MVWDQCDAVAPVVDDCLLEPVLGQVGVIADDHLEFAIQGSYDVPKKLELAADCSPVSVFVLGRVDDFLREKAWVGWSSIRKRGVGRSWVTNQW